MSLHINFKSSRCYFSYLSNFSQSWISWSLAECSNGVNWGCQYYSHTKPNLGDKHKFTSHAWHARLKFSCKIFWKELKNSWKRKFYKQILFLKTKQQFISNHQISYVRVSRKGSKRLMDSEGVKFSGWRKGQKNIWIVYD